MLLNNSNILKIKQLLETLKSEKKELSDKIFYRIKHLRGRHDQRKHNRYPEGYQAQTYEPKGGSSSSLGNPTGGVTPPINNAPLRRVETVNALSAIRNARQAVPEYIQSSIRQQRLQEFSTDVSSALQLQENLNPQRIAETAFNYLQKAINPDMENLSENFISFMQEINSISLDEIDTIDISDETRSNLLETGIRAVIASLQNDEMRGKQEMPSGAKLPIATRDYEFTAEDEIAFQAFQKINQLFGITDWSLKDSDVSKKLETEISNAEIELQKLTMQILGITEPLIQQEQEIKTIDDMMDNIDSIVFSLQQIVDSTDNKKKKKELENIVEVCKKYSKILNSYAVEIGSQFEQSLYGNNGPGEWFAELLEARHGPYAQKITPEIKKFLTQFFGKKTNKDIQTDTPIIDFSTESQNDYSEGLLDDGYGDFIVDDSFDDSVDSTDFVDESISPVLKKSRDEAVKFLKNFIDSRLHPVNTKIEYETSQDLLGFESPLYEKNRNAVVLNQYGSGVAILIHELMHAIQENHNITANDADTMRKLIRGFFIHRTKQNPVVSKTNDLEWVKDNFSDWYAGLLKNGNPEEVLSMGMSMLLANPVVFARQQPDYFRFLSILLSGNWIGKV